MTHPPITDEMIEQWKELLATTKPVEDAALVACSPRVWGAIHNLRAALEAALSEKGE